MLSRVADSLYWMSRYFERADNAARVLGATYSLILNPAKFSTSQRWYKAITRLGSMSRGEEVDPQAAMVRLAFDYENKSSIVSCIGSARENAGQARQEISSEMWEQLNRLYHDISQASVPLGDDASAIRMITAVRDGASRFYGITDSSMNHGEGWHFIQLGKYTERASGCRSSWIPIFRQRKPPMTSTGLACLPVAQPLRPTVKPALPICSPAGWRNSSCYNRNFPIRSVTRSTRCGSR